MSTKKNPPTITPTTIRRPPSEAQLRANRLNAQKSTGPRTEEGKQRASLNATRHGLTGQVLTLTADEMKALHALIGDLEKQYLPGNTQEKHLVHMLGQLQFRLHRIMATEHNLFAIGITENSELWDVNHPEAQTAFVLAETLRRSKDPLLTLSIYEQRLMRQYEKTLKMLREVQAERKAQETREQEAIYEVGMCHLVAGKEFSSGQVWVRLFEGGSRGARQAQMDARTRQQRPYLELRPRILRAGVSFLERFVNRLSFKISFLLTSHRCSATLSCVYSTGDRMAAGKSEILQGTLDLMVLKTLAAMGPLHGYGIARRIEQISQEALQINQGTIYTALVRLTQKGWISAAWGTSENNRRARFYSITKAGRKQLTAETQNWERISAVIGRVLRLSEKG